MQETVRVAKRDGEIWLESYLDSPYLKGWRQADEAMLSLVHVFLLVQAHQHECIIDKILCMHICNFNDICDYFLFLLFENMVMQRFKIPSIFME